MKILLTGASSFSGYWFARELASAGHAVRATMRSAQGSYMDLRGKRVSGVAQCADIVWDCAFGDERFLDLVANNDFDVLCHHGACVENYRSLDFDVAQAFADNIRSLPAILESGLKRQLKSIVLTGSVFEQDEGAGNEPRLAFSPYGLSKGMTADAFRFWCAHYGVPLGKFVIPNPFGPFEEPRFCAYLVQRWSKGESASVKTPAYVRDNIHVSLLAKAYAEFARTMPTAPYRQLNPSGYVESQGAFARRFATEIGTRLRLECRLELARQSEFPEPQVRINTDVIEATRVRWDEAAAWNELADYYRYTYMR